MSAELVERLCEGDEVAGNEPSALVDQLIERVLAIGSRLAPKDRPDAVIHLALGDHESLRDGEPIRVHSMKGLRLDAYEQVGSELNRILTWFHHLMGLQNNPSNGLRGDDDQSVGIGHKTVAFTRSGGRFFVIVTFGTNDQQQDLAWLGLPSGSPYKEIFNSSWPEYQVHNEPELTNGGYNAQLRSGDLIRLPSIGALVLERR